MCGYPPEDLVLRPGFLRDAKKAIEQIAAVTKEAALIIGAPVEEKGNIYNAALLLQHGNVQHVQYKVNLPNYGVFDEKRVFARGTMPEILEIAGTKTAILICEEMWHPDTVAHVKEADLLLVLNASPFEHQKHAQRLQYAEQAAELAQAHVVYVNIAGAQDDLVFDGDSIVLDASGNLLAQAPAFETAVLTVLLEDATKVEDIYPPRLEAAYYAMQLGLKDYVEKNGFDGVILGLSGGIDSALSAVVAADALGPERVRLVMLPSRYTSAESLEDAELLADNLGVTLESFSIESPLEALETLIPLKGLTHENSQSRLRAVILMALSNSSRYLVLTTGNKSEMAVGYATLYGDMCGAYSVLKDAYKTEVFALSRWRNQQGHVMPERIIEKPPSAELREDQKDADSLPDYEVLDAILYRLIEQQATREAIITEGYDADVVQKITKLLYQSEYKRRQSPPGVKLSAKPFSRDRRHPITSKFPQG